MEVKKEPPVEFVLILPRATKDWAAAQQAKELTLTKGRTLKKLASSTKVFKCSKCSYQTKRKENLMQHKGTHNKPFYCNTCEMKFATSDQLKSYHGVFATRPSETFDCEKCGKSYSSSKKLKDHEIAVHDDKEVKCEVCKKIYRNRTLLYYHSRIHVKVECSICDKVISKTSMPAHLRMHSKDRFECDICDFKSKQKRYLENHFISSYCKGILKRNDRRRNVLANIRRDRVPEPPHTHTGSQQVVESPTNSHVQPHLLCDPRDKNPEPFPLLQLSKSLFIQSFLEQIDRIPPSQHLTFKRNLTILLGDSL